MATHDNMYTKDEVLAIFTAISNRLSDKVLRIQAELQAANVSGSEPVSAALGLLSGDINEVVNLLSDGADPTTL